MQFTVMPRTLAVAAALTLASPSFAAEAEKAETAHTEDDHTENAAMMQKWMEMSSPGEAHATLAKAVGEWQTTTEMWQQGPDGPKTESAGTCQVEGLFDGRFVITRCESEMAGRKWAGMGIDGYDNYRQEYTSAWVDSQGTAIASLRGSCDEQRNCTFYGTADDFINGRPGLRMMSKAHWPSDDHHVFEMFSEKPGGEWLRVMRFTLKRATTKTAQR